MKFRFKRFLKEHWVFLFVMSAFQLWDIGFGLWEHDMLKVQLSAMFLAVIWLGSYLFFSSGYQTCIEDAKKELSQRKRGQ